MVFMKRLSMGLLMVLVCNASFAQTKLFTKTGSISFFSKTNVENITAKNNKVLSIWEPASGKIEFSVLMKGFEFEKALMQEHFNENYVESDKYPKATFKGTVENSNIISLTTNKTNTVNVSGALTMHGVTNQINIPATITVSNALVSASASFEVLLADYKIKIPSLVADNINKKIKITVNIPLYKSL